MALAIGTSGATKSVVHLVWLARRADLPESDDEHIVVNPPFQRGAIWTIAQKRRWIETLLDDLPIPAIFLNTFDGHPIYGHREIVIDGQQRLRAVVGFMKDEFDVRGEKWSAQSDEFRRVFSMNVTTPVVYTTFKTESECVALYLKLLTAGTSHTEAELAAAESYLESCKTRERPSRRQKK